MRRKILTLHLLLAAFMAPAFIMVAVSGGLYLLGVKGAEAETNISAPSQETFDIVIDESRNPSDLEADVRALINQLGLDIDFEYLRVRGTSLTTRPTSREHLFVSNTDQGLEILKRTPDLQSSMMELHKGHGPTLFKTFQKVMAVGLLFIVVSGLWLGLTAKGLRKNTLLTSAAGAVIFLLLALS